MKCCQFPAQLVAEGCANQGAIFNIFWALQVLKNISPDLFINLNHKIIRHELVLHYLLLSLYINKVLVYVKFYL